MQGENYRQMSEELKIPQSISKKFGNSDSIVLVWMFQYLLANIIQLVSSFQFSFGEKVFLLCFIGKMLSYTGC